MTGLELMEKISKGDVDYGSEFIFITETEKENVMYAYGEIIYVGEKQGELINKMNSLTKILSATFEPIEPHVKSRYEKPKAGDEYWYMDEDGEIEQEIWDNDGFDNAVFIQGRAFPTKQQAIDFVRAERLIFALEREAWERNPDKIKRVPISLQNQIGTYYIWFDNFDSRNEVYEKYRTEIDWYNNEYDK